MFCLLYFRDVAGRCVSPVSVMNRNLLGLFCRYCTPLTLCFQRIFIKFADSIYTLCKVGHSLNLCNVLSMVYTHLIAFVRRLEDYLFIKTHTYYSLYNHSFMTYIYNLLYNFYIPNNNDIYMNSYNIMFELAYTQLLFTVIITYNTYYSVILQYILSKSIANVSYLLANILNNICDYKLRLAVIHYTNLQFLRGKITLIGFTAFSFMHLNTTIHYNCAILLRCSFYHNHAC